MKLSKKIRRIIFVFAIKKVYGVIISFFLLFFVVAYISNISYTGVYIKTQGYLSYNSFDGNTYIKTHLSDKLKDSIGKKHYAIWYAKSERKRYYSTINSIENEQYSNYLTLLLIPSRKDVEEVFGSNYIDYQGTINLEIYFKQKKIVDKILGNIF